MGTGRTPMRAVQESSMTSQEDQAQASSQDLTEESHASMQETMASSQENTLSAQERYLNQMETICAKGLPKNATPKAFDIKGWVAYGQQAQEFNAKCKNAT